MVISIELHNSLRASPTNQWKKFKSSEWGLREMKQRGFHMDNDLIKWIQEWYINQCDGDWEHECGVRINTIDNPGWSIKIDIANINCNYEISWRLFENSENDWFGYKIVDSYFDAAGDSAKLEFLLQMFKNFIEQGEKALPKKMDNVSQGEYLLGCIHFRGYND
jgi:hypothetical protein